MPNPSPHTIHLLSAPRRVYAAADGVFPQWRFLVIALNLTAESVTLARVAQVRQYGTRTVTRAAAGDRIGPIVQGTREMAPEQVVVLKVQDGTAGGPPPRLVEFEFVFARGGKMDTLYHRVPIEAASTEYLRFPLTGPWVVTNGRPVEHCLGRQFGFDLVAQPDWRFGVRPSPRALTLADCASFGRPLYAPVRGTVTACTGEEEDIAPSPGRASGSGVGNYVVIRSESGSYIFMAHLRQGSLRVRDGQRVGEGQMLGEVGNSGTTSQPHLHIELLDAAPNIDQMGTPDFLASGLPFGFRELTCLRRGQPLDQDAIVPRRGDVLA
jgi:hypothetical protein